MRPALIAGLLLTSQLYAETSEELTASVYRVLEIDEEKLSDSALFASLHMDMDIPRRETRFKPAPEIIDPNQDAMWKRITLPSAIIMTWYSLGLAEGAKWQREKTGSYDVMWKDDYHLYRGITNAGIIGTPMLAMSMHGTRANFKSAIISNLLGWGLYEVTVAHVSNRGQNAHPKFALLGGKFDRPSSAQVLLFSVVSSLAISYTF